MHPLRRKALHDRQAILRAVREALYARGYLEAQVPLLIKGTCPDLAIDSIRAEGGYLTSSTEYQIKRLIGDGFPSVFTLTQNFRRGEVSPVHNPEFTMLEWGRAHAQLDDIEAEAEAFVRAAQRAVAGDLETVSFRGHRVRLAGVPWRRLTLRDAFAEHLAVEVDDTFLLPALRAAVAGRLDVPENFQTTAFDLVSYLLVLLQPELGLDVPVFLREWPAFMTSSAGTVPGRSHLAERSELFIAGLEIADGFPFLTDPARQARYFDEALQLRRAEGKEPVDLDPLFVEALASLPPGAGMALGFDRLVMVLTGREEIRDVLTFAWDER